MFFVSVVTRNFSFWKDVLYTSTQLFKYHIKREIGQNIGSFVWHAHLSWLIDQFTHKRFCLRLVHLRNISACHQGYCISKILSNSKFITRYTNSNLHFTAKMYRSNFAWLFLVVLVSAGLQLITCGPGKLLSSKISLISVIFQFFYLSSLRFLSFIHFKTKSFTFASVNTDKQQENELRKSNLPFVRQNEEVCTSSNKGQIISFLFICSITLSWWSEFSMDR